MLLKLRAYIHGDNNWDSEHKDTITENIKHFYEKHENDIYYIFSTLLVAIFNDNGGYTDMVLIDSMTLAIDFIIAFMKTMNANEIITRNNELYNGSWIDRYIIYFIQSFIANRIGDFFMISNNKYFRLLRTFLNIINIPYLLNKTIESKIYKIIKKKKEYIIKLIVSKQISGIIKHVSNDYLDERIIIDSKEIIPLFDEYDKVIRNYKEVLKNIIIICLFTYLKNYSDLYYKISKLVYNRKSNESIESYNIETSRASIINILKTKQWNKFLELNTFGAIFHIISKSKKDKDFIKKLIIFIKWNLLQMTSLWTIGEFVGNTFAIPICYSILMITKYLKGNEANGKNKYIISKYEQFISSLCISAFFSFYDIDIFLLSIITQFSRYVIFSKIGISFIKSVSKEVIKLCKSLYEINYKYNTTFICIFSLCISNNYFPFINNISLFLPFIFIATLDLNYIFLLIMTLFFTDTQNIFHILHNIFTMYLGISIMNFTNISSNTIVKNTAEDTYSKIKNINLNNIIKKRRINAQDIYNSDIFDNSDDEEFLKHIRRLN